MKDKTDKQLAIEVAKKSGDMCHQNSEGNYVLRSNKTSRWYYEAKSLSHTFSDYLHDKAAEILFMDGMREKIDEYLEKQLTKKGEIYIDYSIRLWWREDDGMDFARKIIEVYLSMEGE
jgi:hypothetical protein